MIRKKFDNGSKAVFLDRDGVINEEIHYLHEPSKFQFIKGVPKAMKILADSGWRLIVITNQGGIGKGLYRQEDMHRTNNHMKSLLDSYGVFLDGIYFCPHISEDNCDCRKPKPGMINQAIKDFHIDPEKSWMIGDKISDIEAGNKAKLKTILVLSGHGEKHKEKLNKLSKNEHKEKFPCYIASNLSEAVEIIIK